MTVGNAQLRSSGHYLRICHVILFDVMRGCKQHTMKIFAWNLNAFDNKTLSKTPEYVDIVALCALFFFIAGIKCMIIASYGNVTPFWDQWDAEADKLFRPFLEGSLNWKDLYAPHNEHRVLTGRLLALLLFVINGNIWNPLGEMVINAFLHTMAVLIAVYGIGKSFINKSTKVVFYLFAAILFSIPLGWENILTNNSSLYFVMLFSFIFLLLLSSDNHRMFLWPLILMGSVVLSYLSFASGALTVASGIAFLAVQWITGVRRNKMSIVVIVMLTLLLLVTIYFTPTIVGHAHYKSQTILDFIIALLRATGGFLLYIPTVVFMLKQVRRSPISSDSSWFLFALCLWISSQILVLCYGRSHDILASRYFDIYAIGLAVNFACIIVLMNEGGSRILKPALRIWLFLVFLGLGFFFPDVRGHLEKRRYEGQEQELHVRAYLKTRNFMSLDADIPEDIPYPDPARLKALLDNVTIQSFLPRSLFSSQQEDSNQSHLFLAGSLLTGISAGLFFILLFTMYSQPCSYEH